MEDLRIREDFKPSFASIMYNCDTKQYGVRAMLFYLIHICMI